MAYITAEQVKEMREMIKKEFPASKGWKWSVMREHHSAVCAALMQYPAGYSFPDYEQLNHFHLESNSRLGDKEKKVLKRVNEILHTGHWDDSDIMTDYFSCSHYVHLHVGKWDKPAVMTAPKIPTPKKVPTKVAESSRYENDFLKVAEFIGIQF
jgi:hypothetical protein